MKGTLRVDKPSEEFYNTPHDLSDLRTFYETLEQALKELKIPFEYSKKADICHHTIGEKVNIKKSYIPGYVYWDKKGYSGWADIADNHSLFQESQELNIEKALEFCYELRFRLARENKSKWEQPAREEIGKEDYVFIPLQTTYDKVYQLARFDPLETVKHIKGREVLIKQHPDQQREIEYDTVNHSIHDLIKNCKCVVTCNSGVGFEALLYFKPVITTGLCDYHWVTDNLYNPEDIDVNFKPSKIKIAKFVFYMVNHYFVKVNDIESIKKRLEYLR